MQINKIIKIISYILTILLIVDFIFLPLTSKDHKFFNQGFSVAEYIVTWLFVIIFWMFLLLHINSQTKIENTIFYKIAFLSISKRNKKRFDSQYKLSLRLSIYCICLIFAVVVLLVFAFIVQSGSKLFM